MGDVAGARSFFGYINSVICIGISVMFSLLILSNFIVAAVINFLTDVSQGLEKSAEMMYTYTF